MLFVTYSVTDSLKLFCGVLFVLLLTLPAISRADFMQWSKTEIQYLHGSNYQEPGNPQDVSQSIVTITHSHGWTYGRNFFFMDTYSRMAADHRKPICMASFTARLA